MRPPGFWGPVAQAAGGDPRADAQRLARGLGATAIASLSVFCILAGLGTWLAGSPEPTWWTAGSGAWIAAQLVVGLGLTPLWWRLGFGQKRFETISKPPT